MRIKKFASRKLFPWISSLNPVSMYLKCRGGGTSVSRLTKIPAECGTQSQHRVSDCAEAGTRCSSTALSESQTASNSNKIIQNELQMIRKNLVSFSSITFLAWIKNSVTIMSVQLYFDFNFIIDEIRQNLGS